jgi:hypothetical protein
MRNKRDRFKFPGIPKWVFSRLHLYSLNGKDEGIKNVYLFSIIAFFILIIASINFMNLSTARSMRRSRETGLRKVVGAGRGQIIKQFSISITLLICTGIIYSQLRYIKNVDMGYDKENLPYLRMNKELSKNYEAFKNTLLQNPNISRLTRTSELPTTIWAVTRGVRWEGKESSEGVAFGIAAVDYDYLQTLKMEVAAGRGFSREIGIRKVFGASSLGVVLLILKGFSKWIVLSNLIAWPTAYIAMNKWLQNFAYRTGVGIETFILSGLLALIIALSTVSYQSIKSANANPVEALKYE